MFNIARTAEYLPTDSRISSSDLLWIAAASVISMAVICGIMLLARAVLKPSVATSFPVQAVFVAAFVIAAGFGGISVYNGIQEKDYENVENLIVNVLKAYDVDMLEVENEIPSDSVKQYQGKVTSDGTVYDVVITQDPESFEPTLVSPQSNPEIDKLRK